MTQVRFLSGQGKLVGFSARGHSGYAESGEDIVCAAVSALTQTCELGLTDVVGIETAVKRDDERGAYEVIVSTADEDKLAQAQLLFRTLLAGLRSIESSYPEFVRVNAK